MRTQADIQFRNCHDYRDDIPFFPLCGTTTSTYLIVDVVPCCDNTMLSWIFKVSPQDGRVYKAKYHTNILKKKYIYIQDNKKKNIVSFNDNLYNDWGFEWL